MNARLYRISLALCCLLCLLASNILTAFASQGFITGGVYAGTPSSASGATPVALASPVAVIAAGQPVKNLAGTSLGIGTTAGNGSTDDTSVINSTLSAGDDVLVIGNAQCTGLHTFTSGTGAYAVSGTNTCCSGSGTGTCSVSGGYLLSSITDTNWTAAVDVPSGRNIRCGNGTYPTDKTNMYFLFSTEWSVNGFNMQGTGSIFGCAFRGPYYGSINSTANGFNQIFINLQPGASSNDVIANNDFNGDGGDIGDINAYGTNQLIEWNTHSNCSQYATQVSGGDTMTLDHERMTDCNCCVEVGSTGGTHITITNAHATFTNGTGYARSGCGQNALCNALSAGDGSSGAAYDYSTNSMSNSQCDGAQSGGVLECQDDSGSLSFIPTYSNITVSGSCVIWHQGGNC